MKVKPQNLLFLLLELFRIIKDELFSSPRTVIYKKEGGNYYTDMI